MVVRNLPITALRSGRLGRYPVEPSTQRLRDDLAHALFAAAAADADDEIVVGIELVVFVGRNQAQDRLLLVDGERQHAPLPQHEPLRIGHLEADETSFALVDADAAVGAGRQCVREIASLGFALCEGLAGVEVVDGGAQLDIEPGVERLARPGRRPPLLVVIPRRELGFKNFSQ